MSRKTLLSMTILVYLTLIVACNPTRDATSTAANLPNPASVHCEERGGKVDLRTDAAGAVTGFCVFPDGSECDEWAYYRGECQPGLIPMPPEQDAAEFAGDGCRVYTNETLGYSLHYPSDAEILQNDDPLKSITISGPLFNGDHWPQITISHPTDREEYRLPEGADLETWVAEHNLLAEPRLEDANIAGITALHTRHERSPQSYAYDRYLFAQDGQIYTIVIGHAADREDWEFYNHFLENIRFTPAN